MEAAKGVYRALQAMLALAALQAAAQRPRSAIRLRLHRCQAQSTKRRSRPQAKPALHMPLVATLTMTPTLPQRGVWASALPTARAHVQRRLDPRMLWMLQQFVRTGPASWQLRVQTERMQAQQPLQLRGPAAETERQTRWVTHLLQRRPCQVMWMLWQTQQLTMVARLRPARQLLRA